MTSRLFSKLGLTFVFLHVCYWIGIFLCGNFVDPNLAIVLLFPLIAIKSPAAYLLHQMGLMNSGIMMFLIFSLQWYILGWVIGHVVTFMWTPKKS